MKSGPIHLGWRAEKVMGRDGSEKKNAPECEAYGGICDGSRATISGSNIHTLGHVHVRTVPHGHIPRQRRRILPRRLKMPF